jgi:hypothetical protein
MTNEPVNISGKEHAIAIIKRINATIDRIEILGRTNLVHKPEVNAPTTYTNPIKA